MSAVVSVADAYSARREYRELRQQRAELPIPDPVLFSRDTLGIDPDPWQATVLRSTSRQMILNCSRQSGKSTTASTLSLHTAMYRPGSLALIVSPTERQSKLLLRKISRLIRHMPNPPLLTEDNKLSLAFANGSEIVALPGSEDTIRGFSAVDLIIEDEASRVDDELYYAVRPMLTVSGGRLVLMSTPWGKRGHFYTTWQLGAGAWERFEIPWQECPRITAATIEEERQSGMPEMRIRSEFGCEFLEVEDAVFHHDDVMRAVTDDVRPLFGRAA